MQRMSARRLKVPVFWLKLASDERKESVNLFIINSTGEQGVGP